MQCTITKFAVTAYWHGEGKSHPAVRTAIHSGQDRLEEQAAGNFMKFSVDKCKVHKPW